VPRQLGEESFLDRFVLRARRTSRSTRDHADVADLLDGADLLDDVPGVVVGIVLFLLLALFVFVGIPVLVALGELAFLLLLTLGGLVARVLFRRPWTVDAVSPDGRRYAWPVVGWRASGDVRRRVADQVRATGDAPSMTDLGLPGVDD
jgi:hypothetical protein